MHSDVEAEEITKRAALREGARKLLQGLIPGDDWTDEIGTVTDGPDHERLARSLAAGIAAATMNQLSAYWMQLQALNAVVEEISDELGEDAMEPQSRAMAHDLEARMRAVAEKMQVHVPGYALTGAEPRSAQPHAAL